MKTVTVIESYTALQTAENGVANTVRTAIGAADSIIFERNFEQPLNQSSF